MPCFGAGILNSLSDIGRLFKSTRTRSGSLLMTAQAGSPMVKPDIECQGTLRPIFFDQV